MVKKHQLIFIFLLICLWELLSSLKGLPGSLEIVQAFVLELPIILTALYHSLVVIFLSFCIASVLVLVLVVLSQNKIIDDCVELLITICHPIPGVALLPVIWMTLGPVKEAVIIIVVHAMLWPFLINVKQEVKRVKHDYGEVLQVFKVSKLNAFSKVYFKGALPSIITGSKISWSRGWRAFISAEMIFSVVGESTGIGWYIFEKRIWGPTAGVFAGIIAIIVISLVIEKYLFSTIEKKTIRKWMI